MHLPPWRTGTPLGGVRFWCTFRCNRCGLVLVGLDPVGRNNLLDTAHSRDAVFLLVQLLVCGFRSFVVQVRKVSKRVMTGRRRGLSVSCFDRVSPFIHTPISEILPDTGKMQPKDMRRILPSLLPLSHDGVVAVCIAGGAGLLLAPLM